MAKSVVTLAAELMQCLAHQQFERLVPHYGPVVKQALASNDLLAKSWVGTIAQTGPFQHILSVKHTPPVVQIQCKCEKKDFTVNFSFDDSNLITGLTFNMNSYHLPPYANLELFTDEEIEVGEGKWKLPGKITVPVAPAKYPCVILVHGSGSLDEDETIGPNKPFKDIAYGLASLGVSVLRYAKRNFQHGKAFTPEELNNFTLIEECVEDPVAAVAAAARHPKIDKDKIFVLGHSLGGFACPLIAQRGGSSVRGLIVLAGSARHLGDMMLQQMKYISETTGLIDKSRLDAVETALHSIHDPDLSENTPKEKLLNIHAKYWVFLNKYDAIALASSLPHPFFVIQASRDYQVTHEDFNMWKTIKDEKRMKFKEYEALNHLMMACDPSIRHKLATPEEYNLPGNVDEQVIKDISEWVK